MKIRSTRQHRPQDWFLDWGICAYFVLRDASVELTLASPKGGWPPSTPRGTMVLIDTFVQTGSDKRLV